MSQLAVMILIYASMYPEEIFAKCKTKFPKGFIFSTATSAFQTEGASRADGKGESIWDNYTRRYPTPIVDGTNNDPACDSYHQFEQDIQLIKDMGFPMHRFSISWPRILPNGDLSRINEAGIEHYHKYIDTLLMHGIEPMVTIYHWDLPQKLQDKGGWLNRHIDRYAKNYADLLFREFGHKVKWWITINEPMMIVKGYCGTDLAPGLNLPTPADYLVGHNILRTHAVIYRLYDKEYRSCQNGKISITLNARFMFPAEFGNIKDMEAAERGMQFELGWFAHPIFSKTGDYPLEMRTLVDENSLKEGRASSRLPYFSVEERESLRGSFDFFGLNHYTSRQCTDGDPTPDGKIYTNIDQNVIMLKDPKWSSSAATWLKVVPSGFRKLLVWIKTHYNNPVVFVTENGYASLGQINDTDRVSYYKKYLKAMLTAINRYQCNIIGYTTWSLLDNFEMSLGYSVRFGLVHVDFQSADRRRTPKESAHYWREILKTHCLPR